MLQHEIYRDCNNACFNQETGVPEGDCVKNCATKNGKLLVTFVSLIRSEIPKIKEISGLQWMTTTNGMSLQGE